MIARKIAADSQPQHRAPVAAGRSVRSGERYSERAVSSSDGRNSRGGSYGGGYPAGPRQTGRSRSAAQTVSQSSRKAAKAETARKKKKRKNVAKVTLLTLSLVGLTVGITAGVLFYAGKNAYKDVFLENTYINGVNVGGMDQAQAINELKKNKVLPDEIYFTRRDGNGFSIKLKDIGYVENSQELIAEYYDGQDKENWLNAKFKDEQHTITEDFNYNKSLLRDIVKHKVLESQDSREPEDAKIVQNDNGTFSVKQEVEGDSVDPAKIDVLYAYIEDQLDENNFDINISRVDCYKRPRIVKDDLYEECSKLNDLSKTELTFDFDYATESIDYSTIKKWVDFDVDSPVGGLEVDRSQVELYVNQLAETYDTFGKDRVFETTNRGTITIPEGQGCYGWWLDKDEMTNLIVRQIENCESYSGKPVYYVNPDSQYSYTCNAEWRTAETDFSDTYFEVDLSAQYMWYYEKGEVKMESPIVSGYISESRNTPAGVYKLWLKERGKTLVGSSDGHSYASYVEFWNYFTTIGVGFHDASWQNGVFGGTKYMTPEWGSHGCINLPYDKAEYIYNNCAYDTPVFMYWS